MNVGDFLNKLPGILTIIFLFGGWVIVAVIGIVAKAWRRTRESEHLAALKQSMIERGMSAEDIERVIRAVPQLHEPHEDESPLVGLTEKLAEHAVPAPALDELLRAYRAADAETQRTLANAVASLLDNGADVERVLVAVRALAGPAQPREPAPREHRYVDDPGSFRR